jgi:CRP-like cAMP-binding protein
MLPQVSAEAVSTAMLASGTGGGDAGGFVAVPPSSAEGASGGEAGGGEAGEGAAAATADAVPTPRVTKSPDAEAAIAAAMDSCFLFAGERAEMRKTRERGRGDRARWRASGPAAPPTDTPSPKQRTHKDLDADQRAEVAGAMTRTYVEAGDIIIREGDAGDHFFVVEAGRFVATRTARLSEASGGGGGGEGGDGGPAITLATYDGRGAFGELALLYGSPRAATVTATSAGVLWAMDRPAFRATVLRLRSARRAAVEASLSTSPLLAALSPEARAAIADCVTTEEFEDGAVILAQGEPVTPGSKLYFVESGRVVCTSRRELPGQEGGDGGDSLTVAGAPPTTTTTATTTTTVGPGGWFGEVALVEPAAAARAADCIAAGRVRLLALGRDAFERVMGPAEAALGASVAAYRQMNAAAEAAARAAKRGGDGGSGGGSATAVAPASPPPPPPLATVTATAAATPASPTPPLPPVDYAPLVAGPAVMKEAGPPRPGSADGGGGGRAIGKPAPLRRPGAGVVASSGYGQRTNKAAAKA